MTKSVPPPIFPAPIPEERFAHNGDIPSSSALRRAASAYNYVSTSQRKMIHCMANYTQSTPIPPDTDESNIYFPFRTGENVESVSMIIGIAPADATSGANLASCQLEIDDGGTTTSSDLIVYPHVASGIYTPADIAWGEVQITVADGLASNTEYLGSIRQRHYSRVHAAMIYEKALPVATSTVAGVTDPLLWESNKPIYDAGVQDLAQAGTKLWQHNGSHLISWSRKDLAGAPTVNSTTWENILDGSVSAYGAAEPGFNINTQYHDSIKAGIPVVLGVYATRTAGTGTLEIKFEDASGTWLSKTGIGTTMNPFNSSTHTVTAAASGKTDIFARALQPDATTWRIDAIGLWEYEA